MHRLAVLGQPISHSLSPAIHAAALRALEMDGEWSYEAIEVDPQGFAGLVGSLPAQGFAGVNVTIPHKQAALELAHVASPRAREIGASNTLSFADGSIRADNTDSEGLLAALPGAVSGQRALVLGAGGAARAAVWGLRDAGADVWVWNRTRARAEDLVAELAGNLIEPGPSGFLETAGFDLIVNTTSVGLGKNAVDALEDLKALRLVAESFSGRQIVVDLAYGNSDTGLLRIARERGAVAVDGREVLVRQAAASFRIWTGVEPPVERMRSAAGLS